MKKKLVMYTNYFYPEVATTGQILTELAEGLSDRFDITIVCAVPCYSGIIDEQYKGKRFHFDTYKGIDIVRVRVSEFQKKSKLSRVKHILTYFTNCLLVTFKLPKQDLIFTVSQPPILGGLIGVFAKIVLKGKLTYQIMDFNPEQTIAVNFSSNKVILRIMMALDKFSCRRSDLVVTLGRDMQSTLENRFRGRKTPNNIVINNWIDEREIFPLKKDNPEIVTFKKKYGLENKFVIMTSGNIGLYYDFQNILKVMASFREDDSVAFVFVGEGAVKADLVKYTEENDLSNVIFIPFQDKKYLNYSLNAADIHIVTNAVGVKGVSVPSKIYGILATNIPIWGILEEGSEAWNIIEDSRCGKLVKAGDYNVMRNSLADIINQKEIFVEKHSTGRVYLEKYYTKKSSIDAYYEGMNNL